MRVVLALLRALGLCGFLLGLLSVTVFVFPWVSQSARGRQSRWWARLLLGIAGVRLRVSGRELPVELSFTGVEAGSQGRLVLANHISWLDIFALTAVLPARFVAKAEIGRWPLVGAMVTAAGTLYIERGRRHAVASMNDHVVTHLKRGETVAVFPEGTTTLGDTLLPFHSNLVAPAIEVGGEIWPVALRYTEAGEFSRVASYAGELTLVQSIWQIVQARELEVEIAFLPVVPAHGATRHALTEAARMSVASHLGLAVEPRRRAAERRFKPAAAPESEPAGTAPETRPDPAASR
ncbi:MAG: lysophospholipid acyltransferase family protein [Burkholderiaceae bacterium]